MDTNQRIKDKVEANRVVLFMKGNRDFPDDEIRQGIKDYSNWPTIPQLYIDGEFVGGSDIMMEMYQNGELKTKLDAKSGS